MALHLIEQILVAGAGDAPASVQDVLIDDERIAHVAPHIDVAALKIDERTAGYHRMLIPGFVNAHHHSHDRFDKGRFSSLPLELWMSLYNPPNHQRGWTAQEVYLRTAINGCEMLKGGITTVIDDIHFGRRIDPALVDAAFRAYRDLGMRAEVGVAWCDRPFDEAIPYLSEALPAPLRAACHAGASSQGEVLALWKDLAAQWSGPVRFVLSASAPQRCSDGFLEATWELARTLRRPLHLHLLETKVQLLAARRMYGVSMVEHLRERGLLDSWAVFAHGAWASLRDLDTIAEAGATIVHNPGCNLKLGSGIAPVADMLSREINVALGTDNNCGNDLNSMFDAMRLAAFSGAIRHCGARPPIDARCCFALATCGGARAAGRAPPAGTIAAGQLADLSILRLDVDAFTPLNDPVVGLVFAEQGASVEDVYVGGRRVVHGRRLTTIDEAELARELVRRGAVMQARVLSGQSWAELLRPHLMAAYERCLADPALTHLRGALNLVDAN